MNADTYRQELEARAIKAVIVRQSGEETVLARINGKNVVVYKAIGGEEIFRQSMENIKGMMK